MINFNSIMIGSDQPKVLGEFYEKVFGRKADMGDGEWFGWKVGELFFNIGEHSEVSGQSKTPERLILNFEAEDVKKEFDSIKDIDGITVVKEPYEMEGMDGLWIATLADPDGNYFQLMSPWDEGKN